MATPGLPTAGASVVDVFASMLLLSVLLPFEAQIAKPCFSIWEAEVRRKVPAQRKHTLVDHATKEKDIRLVRPPALSGCGSRALHFHTALTLVADSSGRFYTLTPSNRLRSDVQRTPARQVEPRPRSGN